MKKLTPTSPADLLGFLASPMGLNDMIAALLGYEIQPDSREQRSIERTEVHSKPVEPISPPDPVPPPPQIQFPTERPQLTFLMATTATTLKVETPGPLTGDPIPMRDLAMRWDQPGLPLRPLVPWARLAPYLKRRLGAQIASSRLDLRKLVLMTCAGQPVTDLPYRKRTAWAAQLVVLWDQSPEMYPFREDFIWLRKRLKAERGENGIKYFGITVGSEHSPLANIPPETVILAVSAMGQFQADPAVKDAWLALGRRLKSKGHSIYAINPCPRVRWSPELAIEWSIAHWDRGHPLPRHGSMTAVIRSDAGRNTSENTAKDELLTLLAPAIQIRSPLLREARLLGRPKWDAGTEWDSWYHEECWQSGDCFGYQPGAEYDARLANRAAMVDGEVAEDVDRELADKIEEAIRAQYESSNRVAAAEAELRICLSGSPDEVKLNNVVALLRKVVDRLRKEAMEPGGLEGAGSGLASWFPKMVHRLSPEMRRHESVKDLIAQGLALAYTWLQTDAEIPDGVDNDLFDAEARLASRRISAGPPDDYIVGLDGTDLTFVPAGSESKNLKPIGRIRVGGTHRVQIRFAEPGPSPRSLQLGNKIADSISLAPHPSNLKIESSHGLLDFEARPRPAWAERMWYDQYGLAAEFSISGVPFVMRWIPPGRFQMGSPESETGRFGDEGPQHEVTISHGFWLGETPVTQGQWLAAVKAGTAQRKRKKNALKPTPSHFKGPENLPVEQVSWNMCDEFFGLMKEFVELDQRLGFRFPTEAEWEYACRAGTESVFNDGSPCTEPDGNDPAIAELGWFNENSEQKTHPVQEKRPNAWGLYDMHGNVWEWCLDAWDEEVYSKRGAEVVNPLNLAESGHRVVRGGSWWNQARLCRAACRNRDDPGFDWVNLGFRLSAGLEPVPVAARPVPSRRSRG